MENLEIGMKYSYCYKVPIEKTVPYLYPEVEELQVMPEVFTSGFMIGMFEYVCVKALVPYLDWPKEQTVGVGFNLSHSSPTPPEFCVMVDIELISIEKNKLIFKIIADDGVDIISEGTHERHIIKERVFQKVLKKKIDNYENKSK
ncbi:thioesterase [Arcobacter sp. 31_11_sub10_T18]|nr:thioesterase [Arcobacter sp. 31_11_sub10_T18]